MSETITRTNTINNIRIAKSEPNATFFAGWTLCLYPLSDDRGYRDSSDRLGSDFQMERRQHQSLLQGEKRQQQKRQAWQIGSREWGNSSEGDEQPAANLCYHRNRRESRGAGSGICVRPSCGRGGLVYQRAA